MLLAICYLISDVFYLKLAITCKNLFSFARCCTSRNSPPPIWDIVPKFSCFLIMTPPLSLLKCLPRGSAAIRMLWTFLTLFGLYPLLRTFFVAPLKLSLQPELELGLGWRGLPCPPVGQQTKQFPLFFFFWKPPYYRIALMIGRRYTTCSLNPAYVSHTDPAVR